MPEAINTALSGFGSFLTAFFSTVSNLGAAVLLPIVLGIVGVFFRMKIPAALKASLMVGIGFQGLILVVNFMIVTIQPVVKHYQDLGTGYTAVDIGFAAVGGAAWGLLFAVLSIPVIILLNLLLIKLKVVNVLNIDIWNFIHFMIPGVMAYALFNSAIIGFLVIVGLSLINLFFAQWVAPKWEKFFGLEGTTCTTLSFIALWYPISLFFNWLIDRIPGVRRVNLNMEKLEKRMGFFGNPMFIGLIVGTFLGVLTLQGLPTILTMAVGFAAVMLLLPRTVSIMMEGITSIAGAAQTYMKKRVKSDRKIYIGMDIALGLGYPACITATAISIPFVILWAFIIPGMTVFPLALLAEVAYMTPMIALACRGNTFRTVLLTILLMGAVVFAYNEFVPEATAMMQATGVDISGQQVSSAQFGINPGNILVAFTHRMFGSIFG